MRNYINEGHNGIAHSYYFEEGNKGYSVDHQTAEQNQAVLDENARLRQLGGKVSGMTLDGRRVEGLIAGQIPTVLYYILRGEWEKNHKHYVKWVPFLMAILDSREYSQLKTVEGKLPVEKHQM